MNTSLTFARFTVAYWCVLIAALLPIVCAGIAKWGAFNKPRRDGGYDNANPRAWLARQTDWRARANAAQANSFEALPFFIVAGLPTVRSIAWTAAFVVNIAILFVGYR